MTTGAFNPATSQLRMVKAADATSKPLTGYQDFRFRTHGLAGEYTLFDLDDIRGDGQATPGLASTINLADLPISVNWRPQDHARLIAAIEGAVTSANISGAAYKHTIKPHTGTNAFSPIVVQSWRDDGIPIFFYGGRAAQATWAIQKPGVLQGGINLSFESYTRYDIAQQTTGTSTDPDVRGLPRPDIVALADGDIYIKVTDDSPFQIKVKIGSASTYDGAAIDVTPGTDVELLDENDERIGTRDMPVLARWANATGIALNDEWRIRREADKWAASLPTDYPLNETLAYVLYDGERFQLENMTVTRNRPLNIPANVGGRFLPGITEQGERGATWALVRKQIDVRLIRALEAGASVSLEMHCYSGVPLVAGNDATEPRISFYSRDCRIAGRSGGVDSPERHTENITLTAYPNADGTYPDDLTIEVVNSLTALT